MCFALRKLMVLSFLLCNPESQFNVQSNGPYTAAVDWKGPEIQLCQKKSENFFLLYFVFLTIIFTWDQALTEHLFLLLSIGRTHIGRAPAGRTGLYSSTECSQTFKSKELSASEQIQQPGAPVGRIIPGTPAYADCMGTTSWLQTEIVGELWSTSCSWLFS